MTTYPIEKRCKTNHALIVRFTAERIGTVVSDGPHGYTKGYQNNYWLDEYFEPIPPADRLYTLAEVCDDLEPVLTWNSTFGCLEWNYSSTPSKVMTTGPIFDEFKRRHDAKQVELDALAASVPDHLKADLIERLKNA